MLKNEIKYGKAAWLNVRPYKILPASLLFFKWIDFEWNQILKCVTRPLSANRCGKKMLQPVCFLVFFAQLYLTLTRQEMEGKSREYGDRDFTALGSRQNCCFSLWVCFCNPTLPLVCDHTSPAITLHLYSVYTYLIYPKNIMRADLHHTEC